MAAEEEKKKKKGANVTNMGRVGPEKKKKKEKEKPIEENTSSLALEDYQKKKTKKKMKAGNIAEISLENTKKKKKKKKEEGANMETNTSVSDRADGDNSTVSNAITDPRFADVLYDPRFRRMPKQKMKVPIDSRFNRIFSDKKFSASSAPLDKRGKPRKSTAQNPLLRYYYPEKEEEEIKGVDLQKGGGRSSSSESSSESDSSESEAQVSDDFHASASETSSSTSSDEDEDIEGLYSDEDLPSEKEDVPLIEQETRRLAIVNMDWSHVKAVDLYVLLSSFLPKGDQLLSVAVYPSEFGLQRMEYEAVHGPADLFDDEENSDDDDKEVDNEKLRAYEKSRMRYYYAVVECDSSATADHLYKTCDGTEFERTSNVLDMRFIPDSMEFRHPPRDVATEVPATYEALDFHTSALQQSKINLTWDEDEPERQKIMKRRFNSDQLDELEFKEFLASDDDESDEDDEDIDESKTLPDGEKCQKTNKRDKYLALVQSGDGSDSEHGDLKDMEVTFNTGLEDISKKLLEKKKDKKVETVWEAYLRKRSEKRKARKKGSKVSSDDDGSDSDRETEVQSDADDFFMVEPLESETKVSNPSSKNDLSKKARQRKSQKDGNKPLGLDKEQDATREELELLLADEQGVDRGVKGYNIKANKGKGKKGEEMVAEEKLPCMDIDDPRFSALFASPLFALDPTDPQFKRSATYARQLLEKRKKGEGMLSEKLKTRPPEETQPSPEENDEQLDLGGPSKRQKLELSSLVRSVKRKVGSLQS